MGVFVAILLVLGLCDWSQAGYLHGEGEVVESEGAYIAEAQPILPVHHSSYLGGDIHHEGGALDYYSYPKYSYKYGVHDPLTGDEKNHWEARNGDLVKGSYSVKEADGTTRVVDYTADKHNGFNAVVKTIGHAIHPPVYHSHHDSLKH